MSGQVLPSAFLPPVWLRGPHAQTILPNTLRLQPSLPGDWEDVTLSDGDRVELLWSGPPSGPIALLLHGLGGSGESPPMRGLARALVSRGWRVARFHFRGAGRRPNLRPTSYHSGMTADPLEVLHVLARRYAERPRVAVGVSLGGNVLLRLLGEQGDDAPVDAAVAISVPFDLSICVQRMNQGFSRIYQRVLLRRLRPLITQRRELLRSHIDVESALAATSFRAFDERVTAPLHGYANADDYYLRASSRPILRRISRPTLILHSADDPFMSPAVVPAAEELAEGVTLELSQAGGHVGFVQGPPWRPTCWLDGRVADWLEAYRSRA